MFASKVGTPQVGRRGGPYFRSRRFRAAYLTGAAVLALLSLLNVPAVATMSQGGDRASGAFQFVEPGGFVSHANFTASSGPAGEEPGGILHVVNVSSDDGSPRHFPFNFVARVVCVSIIGNRVGLDAVVTHSSPTGFEGELVTAVAQDNGEPGAGQDLFTSFVSFPNDPLECFPLPQGEEPIPRGNIQVHDAAGLTPP
jgi:hypothetical protein